MHYTDRVVCSTEFCKMSCLRIVHQRSCEFQLFKGRTTSRSVASMAYTLASALLIVSIRMSHLSCSPTQFSVAFRKVLDSNEPKSMVAIPEFDKFLVHCDSALYSYPLEIIAQGDATPGSIANSEEILGNRRDILFFRTGRLENRTLSK
jgi:hypothetical protein